MFIILQNNNYLGSDLQVSQTIVIPLIILKEHSLDPQLYENLNHLGVSPDHKVPSTILGARIVLSRLRDDCHGNPPFWPFSLKGLF